MFLKSFVKVCFFGENDFIEALVLANYGLENNGGFKNK